jgi:para-nitrobenzyl esterase
MLELAGVPAAAFRELPLARLLELQVAHIRANAAFGLTTTPFRPFADGTLIPEDALDAAARGARAKRVMLGWTRDELAAFFAGSPDVLGGSAAQLEGVFRSQWGENWREGLAFARARVPGAGQDRLLDAGLNECMFAGSTVALAERLAAHEPAWLYRFDWAAPGNPFGACHCIELPFVFETHDRWRAPMLEGALPAEMAALGRTMRTTWAQFVREGDPNHEGLAHWPRYRREGRATLRIDRVVETVGDLAGVTQPGRPWPARLALPERPSPR